MNLPPELFNLIKEYTGSFGIPYTRAFGFPYSSFPVLDRLERELKMSQSFTSRCNKMLHTMQELEPGSNFAGYHGGPFQYGGPHKWESWWIRAGVWEPGLSEAEHWEHFKDCFNEEVNTWSIEHPVFTQTNMFTQYSIL